MLIHERKVGLFRIVAQLRARVKLQSLITVPALD